MEVFPIAVACLILGAGALGIGLKLRRTRALKRRLKSTALRPIAQVTEGPVVIQGYAIPLQLLRSPISGKRVVGYRIKVEEQKSYGRSSHWKTLVDHCAINDFEVEDTTGRALVHAIEGQLILQLEERQNNGFFKSTPPALVQLLKSMGESAEGLFFKKSLRWSEYFLEEGEAVCVFGHARREACASDAPQGYREPPTRVILQRPADGPLIIGDQHLNTFLKSLGLFADLPSNLDP